MNNIDFYHNKVNQWLESYDIKFKHMIFDKSCHSVEEAVISSGEPIEFIVKSICMIDDNNNLIVAIVSGNDRASTSRVVKALNIDKPRVAHLNEVLEKTGFPAGGVPSFSYNAIFVVDSKVSEKEYVLTGGGSEFSLIKIRVLDLIELNNANIARIRK